MNPQKLFFAILAISLTLVSCKVRKQDFTNLTNLNSIPPKQTTVTDITEDDIRWHISVLASDSMNGRAANTPYEAIAAGYIKKAFDSLGLKTFNDDYLQQVLIPFQRHFYDCELNFEDCDGDYPADFRPLIMFDSLAVAGDVVFAGYGSNSIYENLDVKGKWVMILERSNSILSERKAAAKSKGALGVLVVGIDGTTGNDRYSLQADSVPMIKISHHLSDRLLAHAGTTISEVLEKAKTGEDQTIHIPVAVNATIKSKMQYILSQNVVACLESGVSGNENEYIVIGAHYDHMKTRILNDSMQIFNGADDNASGVAGVLEIAEKLCAGEKLKYNVIFVAFGAEELGLVGSRHFCDNPPVPLEKIKFMFNLDMIGRMDSDNHAYITPIEPNDKLNDVLEEIKGLHPDINVSFSSDMRFRGSDHTSFNSKRIPAISFTTGLHDAYHTPADTTGSINFKGEKLYLDFIYDFVISPAMDNCIRSLTSSEVNP